eukprot:1226422-Alexandrium_andersonii.AAC.1
MWLRAPSGGNPSSARDRFSVALARRPETASNSFLPCLARGGSASLGEQCPMMTKKQAGERAGCISRGGG